MVAALDIDFRADYVRQVQDSIMQQTFLAFVITYGVLFALVLLLSNFFTRPVVALTGCRTDQQGDYAGSLDQLADLGNAPLFADETTPLPSIPDYGRQGVPARKRDAS